MLLYLLLAMIGSFFAAAVVVFFSENIQESIYKEKIVHQKGEDFLRETGEQITDPVQWGRHRISLSTSERLIVESCDFLSTWSGLLIPLVGCGAAMLVFYRKKIRPPMEEIDGLLGALSRGEWEYSVSYRNKDELGQICEKFELMRRRTAENNKELWSMVEEQKALRAAIAHDLRSPLAVLGGYQEMLLEMIPEGLISREKEQEILHAGMEQIERMNRFAERMRELSSLEKRTVQIQEIRLSNLAKKAGDIAEVLEKKADREVQVDTAGVEKVEADEGLVMEVYENLLGNALRYAKKKVTVRFEGTAEYLVLTVQDDGDGFREVQETVTAAWYHSNPKDDLKHFGLGLYLARMYCEKHGGRLLIFNHQGGCVRAEFGRKKEKTERCLRTGES